MDPQTKGIKYSAGKIVPIKCVAGDSLKDIDIKDQCYLLILLYEGSVLFRVEDATFEAVGPCFVCFGEHASPVLLRKRGARCDSVYFKPTFLNINMTFSRIQSEDYEELAARHDMFLLKPFTDPLNYVFPVFDEHIDNLKRLFLLLEDQLREQPDWYWSCRSRSYFMEMILLLERTFWMARQMGPEGRASEIRNPHLRKAVIYIENNYHDKLALEDVARAASINHSTLTKLFKDELNMTPIEYLWHHRLVVAKKFLEFTSLPIKDVASRCGFKTPQHFSRKFEETMGTNPSAFREAAVTGRKKTF